MVGCNLHNGISKNDAANDEVVDMVHVIFTIMVNYKVLPKDFNVSIIKPLLKEVTKLTMIKVTQDQLRYQMHCQIYLKVFF